MKTVREWIESFRNGEFDSKSRDVQGDAGWNDWFCQDKALRNKTYKLAGLITRLKEEGKIDFDRHHVAFNNKCPMSSHPLYDALYFVTFENGTFNHYIVVVDDKRNDYKYVVFDGTDEGTESYSEPVLMTNKRDIVLKWFNNEPIDKPNPFIIKTMQND